MSRQATPGARAQAQPTARKAALAAHELHQAEQFIAKGQGPLARALLLAMLEEHPGSAEVHRLLCIEALECAEPERWRTQALPHAKSLVGLQPKDGFAQMLLGRVHKVLGELGAAQAAYHQAIQLNPLLAPAHVSLGIVLKLSGDLPGAVACQRRALEIDPQLAAAHSNLGIALARLIDLTPGRPSGGSEQALAAHQRAVEADSHNVAARHNLGLSLLQAGRTREAVDHFNAALALDTRRLDSCLALHSALGKLFLHEAARQCCERWLDLNPAHSEVVNRLATSLLALGDLEAAQSWVDKALAMAPDTPEVLHNAGHLRQQSLDVGGALQALRHARQMAPGYAAGWQTLLMCLNYLEEDQTLIAEEHRRFGAYHGTHQRASRAADPSTSGRLRVGWLSGDLRRHSVAYFIEPLFEAFDRSRFEFLAYDTSPASDEVSARLRAHASAWVDAGALTDDELAARIQADGVDLLVDLAGHTAGSRVGVFARRAAALQISYLGYPTTTGLPAMDLRLTDAIIDPPYEPDTGHEGLLRLPGGMFCYRPDALPEIGPLPASRKGHITFGSFNNLAKLSPKTLALWADTLHAVPGSQLMLKAKALSAPRIQQSLQAQFLALGIGPERLLLKPWSDSLHSHLDLYQEVDIGLDTYPYNGATTTCEALWMGVPVLSLCGSTHVSRSGASILHAAGLDDWIAHSREAFVGRAVALAGALAPLGALRATLRQRLLVSRLLDAKQHAHELQALLEKAWLQHRAAAAELA